MGNTFSSSNALHIQLSKPFYYAGDVIDGVVAFNCINQLNISGIQVEVVGYEDTSFYKDETTHSSFDDDLTHTAGRTSYNGHQDFFRATVPLGPPGAINPGQYQFGFKLELPPTVPPSFEYRRAGASGVVAYKIRAVIDQTGLGFDIKTEIPLYVVDKPSGEVRPVGNSAQQEVTMCCCMGQGFASLNVSLEKDCFSRGEVANVVIQGRNGTQKGFDSIKVNLKRMLVVYSSSSAYNSDKQIDKPVSIPIQGFGPGETAEGPMARRTTLQIPADLPPSVVGRLVQCHYTIEAELGGGFGVSSVKCQVPVRISAAPTGAIPAPPSMEAPPGWKPQVYPTVEIPQPPQMPAAAPQQQAYAPSAPQAPAAYYQPAQQPMASAPPPANYNYQPQAAPPLPQAPQQTNYYQPAAPQPAQNGAPLGNFYQPPPAAAPALI